MIKRLSGRMMTVLVALCAACATVQDRPLKVETEAQKIMIAPSFNRQAVETGGVAILPVISKIAPEGIRSNAAFEVLQALKNSLPNVSVLPVSNTMELLKQNGIEKEFKVWLAAYQAGGPIDPVLLRRVGLITARRYLLVVEVDQYKKESKPVDATYNGLPSTGLVKSPTLSQPTSYDIFKDIKLTGRLWDSECRSIAWEGQGRARVTDESPHERIRMEDLFLMAVQNFVSAFLGSAGTAKEAVQGC